MYVLSGNTAAGKEYFPNVIVNVKKRLIRFCKNTEVKKLFPLSLYKFIGTCKNTRNCTFQEMQMWGIHIIYTLGGGMAVLRSTRIFTLFFKQGVLEIP
jgi:NAD kinase